MVTIMWKMESENITGGERSSTGYLPQPSKQCRFNYVHAKNPPQIHEMGPSLHGTKGKGLIHIYLKAWVFMYTFCSTLIFSILAFCSYVEPPKWLEFKDAFDTFIH